MPALAEPADRIFAIGRPYLEQGWWVVPLSNGRATAYETRSAAERFYVESRVIAGKPSPKDAAA